MLTCIACSKQLNGGSSHEEDDGDSAVTPRTKQSVKSLTSQIKEIAIKATGAYKSCKPCTSSSATNNPTRSGYADSDRGSMSGRFFGGCQRTGNLTPRVWGKEMEARLKGLSSGASTPVSVSGRTESAVVFTEEDEGKEWIAQVEPGVLITFISLASGGNDLKRIRFSREIFNKWQAQRWWSENREKLMELYNVQRFNLQGIPLPSPPTSEAQSSITESTEASPVTPQLSKEHTPRNFYTSSSDSLDQQHNLTSIPKFSNISGSKTEASSLEASRRTSSSQEADQSGEFSLRNASDAEEECVLEDEPGVYVTIRILPGGVRELRRVRFRYNPFSRERFGEMHARLWWEQNRARIQQQYL